jgi:hypothetical protein
MRLFEAGKVSKLSSGLESFFASENYQISKGT